MSDWIDGEERRQCMELLADWIDAGEIGAEDINTEWLRKAAWCEMEEACMRAQMNAFAQQGRAAHQQNIPCSPFGNMLGNWL